MANNGKLHDKTFDIVLNQLTKIDSSMQQPLWNYIVYSLAPLDRGFNQVAWVFHVQIICKKSLFDLLAGYINVKEMLLIKGKNEIAR